MDLKSTVVILLSTFIVHSSCLPNPTDILQNDFDNGDQSLTNTLQDKDTLVNSGVRDNTLRFNLENKYKDWFLDEKKAKTIARTLGTSKDLFRRKRWSIKAIWGEEEEEEESETSREVANCQASCWAGWQQWTPCTAKCGNGGVRSRSRQTWPNKNCRCPGPSYDEAPCNRRCFNGGTAAAPDFCTCVPGFTGRCCDTKIQCGDPGVPQNGVATPYGTSFDYDTVVRYTCNEGYTLAGSVNTRRCGNNGRWTGSTPVCQRVRCRDIGAPQFGTVTSPGIIQYESIVQFSCNVGYFLRGSETSICQADGSWSHPLPTCSKGECGDPGSPPHGQLFGLDYSYNSVVRYQCDEGYVLVGPEERRCQADGTWTCEQPRCLTADSLLKKCPLLDDIDNGVILFTQGLLYQSIAEYACNEGYYLDGHEHRACQVNEEWSGRKPECKAVQCEPLTAPAHGRVTQRDGFAAFGSKATFSCSHGHVLEGNEERICGGNGPVGIWSGIQPSCQAIRCGAPTAPTNGRVVGYSYNYEDNVTVECGPGFYLEGSDLLSCTRDGIWVGNMDDSPICVECSLNEYSLIISSSRTCTVCPVNSETDQTGSSDSRQCKCKKGFHRRLYNDPCEPIICDLPPVLPGVNVIGTCNFGYGDGCQFDCANGYVRFIGHLYRTCSGTGQWTGEPLQCAPCPKNTYKLDSISCATCPPYSETLGVNSSRTDCIPLQGFTLDAEGFILDVNECLDDSTNPCVDKDKCVNTAGGARCDCPAGSIQAPNFDGSVSRIRCIPETSECPRLTAPLNGGLECNKTGDTETCRVYCDVDYEFLMLYDTFEMNCGPSTEFVWSHTLNNQTMPECVFTLFGDLSFKGLVSYPKVDCAELTQNEKQTALNTFVDLAESEGVCYKNPGYMCEVVKADAVCSREDDDDDEAVVLKFDRKKRNVEGDNRTDTVSFNFTFKLDPYFYKDNHACDDMLCREKFETLLEFTSWRTTESLKHLVDNCDLCFVSDDGNTLQAELKIDQHFEVTCPNGALAKERHCVCRPGLMYDHESNSCRNNDEETSSGDSDGNQVQAEENNCPYEPNPCTEENIREGIIDFRYEDDNKLYVECNPSYIGECRIGRCADGYVFNPEERVCVWG